MLELVQSSGFTQVLYAYQPVIPRLPDGQWVPLKLNVRNFPRSWEHGWSRFEIHDPYYYACFDGTLPFDWRGNIQGREGLMPAEREAWHYLADLGLGRGMTIPIPPARADVLPSSAPSSIVRASNWDSIFSGSQERFSSSPISSTMSSIKGASRTRSWSHSRFRLRPGSRKGVSALGRSRRARRRLRSTSSSMAQVEPMTSYQVPMNKLNAHTRREAIAKAAQLGTAAVLSWGTGRASRRGAAPHRGLRLSFCPLRSKPCRRRPRIGRSPDFLNIEMRQSRPWRPSFPRTLSYLIGGLTDDHTLA